MIYFLRSGASGAVKIGYTANLNGLEARMTALQVGNPEPICLMCCIEGEKEDEKLLHRKLRKHHIRGEWFAASDVVLYMVDKALHFGAKAVLGPQLRDPETGDIMVPSVEYRQKYGPELAHSAPFDKAA